MGRVSSALARALGTNQIYVFRLARILKAPRRSRNFSTWLVGELLLLGISQEELAEQSGVDLEKITELTQGVVPDLEILEKITSVLNRDVVNDPRLKSLGLPVPRRSVLKG